MDRQIGYDIYGFFTIFVFIVCCLWGIDENWQLRFNGQFYINKERLWIAALTLFLAMWQLWTAVQELTPSG